MRSRNQALAVQEAYSDFKRDLNSIHGRLHYSIINSDVMRLNCVIATGHHAGEVRRWWKSNETLLNIKEIIYSNIKGLLDKKLEVEDMQKMAIALILIILGLIVIAFPLLGFVPVAVLSGFLLFMLGIGLILAGIKEIGESEGAALGISLLILGFIALILDIGLIVSPALFAWVVSFIVWIIGLFLIITGIARILSKTGDNRCGVKDIIIGVMILFVGLFLATYTWLLGVLIGLWLLSTGLRMLYNPDFSWIHPSLSA